MHIELLVAIALVTTANFSLLHGQFNSGWLFLPGQVADGQWWRVVLHPWLHVSWYHLLLDTAAFVLVYHELRHLSTANRISAVFATGVGSLLAAVSFDPNIAVRGLCGLSGIAHGLMAMAAIETMRHRGICFWLGLVSFLLVVGKCAAEAITGTVIFDFLHAGQIGSPVAVSHAGGVLGALVAAAVWRRSQ